MLSRNTVVEQKAQDLGDMVRMSYAGQGKNRQDFAKKANLPEDTVKGIVQGRAHTYGRADLLKVVSALAPNEGQARDHLLALVVEITPKGFQRSN